MKLVRAKLKTNIESPCCEQYLQEHYKEHVEKGVVRILDLDNTAEDSLRCAYCHKSLGVVYGVWDTKSAYYTPLFLYNLDEGIVQ